MNRIMLLSNNINSEPLYDRLIKKGYDVSYLHEPITLKTIKEYNPELIISYNYKYIISEDVINQPGVLIINMHISFLPWNRGSSPNIWSFIDDTPKGVTIHSLEKGLDKGKIILQKECKFDENTETLESTYNKLNDEIIRLLMDNWEMFESGNFPMHEQRGVGSYHRMSDLDILLAGRQIDYSMTIAEFKKFIQPTYSS